MRQLYSLILMFLITFNTSCVYGRPCIHENEHHNDYKLLNLNVQLHEDLYNQNVCLGAYIHKDSIRARTFNGEATGYTNLIYVQVVPYLKHNNSFYILEPQCNVECNNNLPSTYSFIKHENNNEIRFEPTCYTTLAILMVGSDNSCITSVIKNMNSSDKYNILDSLIPNTFRRNNNIRLRDIIAIIKSRMVDNNFSKIFAISNIDNLKELKTKFLGFGQNILGLDQNSYTDHKIPIAKYINIQLPENISNIVSNSLSTQNLSFKIHNDFCNSEIEQSDDHNEEFWAYCLDSYKQLTITVLGRKFVKKIKEEKGVKRIIIKDSEINLNESKIIWPKSWGKFTVGGWNYYSETSENGKSVLRCYGEWSNIKLSKAGWKDISVSKEEDVFTYDITNKFVPDKNFPPINSLSHNCKTIANCENELCYSYTKICYYNKREPNNKACFSELENADNLPFLYNKNRSDNYNYKQKWKLPDTIELSLTYCGDKKYFENKAIKYTIGTSKKLTEYTMELLSPEICKDIKTTYIITSSSISQNIITYNTFKTFLKDIIIGFKSNPSPFIPICLFHTCKGSGRPIFQCNDYFDKNYSITIDINSYMTFNKDDHNNPAFDSFSAFVNKYEDKKQQIKKILYITEENIDIIKMNKKLDTYFSPVTTFTKNAERPIPMTVLTNRNTCSVWEYASCECSSYTNMADLTNKIKTFIYDDND